MRWAVVYEGERGSLSTTVEADTDEEAIELADAVTYPLTRGFGFADPILAEVILLGD